MNWLDLLILILVNYRLARLIAIDDGPAEIMLAIRARLGAYDFDENGQERSNLGRGIKCMHCVGFWTALFLVFCYVALYQPLDWRALIVYQFAIAGGQSFLSDYIKP